MYVKQYMPILDILSFKELKNNQKLVIAFNTLDFTEYKRKPKSSEWMNLQRLAYSKLLSQQHGLPDEYVGWELCYHFWRNLNIGTGLKLEKDSFIDVVNEMVAILSHGLAENIIDGQKYVSFVDLVDYSKDKSSAEIITILDSLFAANKVYDDVFGTLPQIQISRINNSIFGSNSDMQKKKKNLVESFLIYLLQKVESWIESGIRRLARLNNFSPPISGRTNGCYSLKEIHRKYEIIFEIQRR